MYHIQSLQKHVIIDMTVEKIAVCAYLSFSCPITEYGVLQCRLIGNETDITTYLMGILLVLLFLQNLINTF